MSKDFKKNASLYSALDDVHTRFILNIPSKELASSTRLFFQLEQAHWFYSDFLVDSEEYPDSTLPTYKTLKAFALIMFEFSPLLSIFETDFDHKWNDFRAYKRGISTYGAILLDDKCEKLVLCNTWDGKSWTFPSGKKNEGESAVACAARETYEETGFDISSNYGLTASEPDKYPSVWTGGEKNSEGKLGEDDGITVVDNQGGAAKQRTQFVIQNVPTNFPFNPISRNEVREVRWFDFWDLPKSTFAVRMFQSGIKRWIKVNKGNKVWRRVEKKMNAFNASGKGSNNDTTDHDNSNNNKNNNSNSRSNSNVKERKNASAKRERQPEKPIDADLPDFFTMDEETTTVPGSGQAAFKPLDSKQTLLNRKCLKLTRE